MKKALLICMSALILLSSAACSKDEGTTGEPAGPELQSAQESQLEGDSPDVDDVEDLPQAEPLPEMTEEQQVLCDQYLAPLLYSNFFAGDYFYKTLDMEWGPGGIITIYQDLVGMDAWTGLADEHYQIPASEVEGVLMRYFPFDEATIQIAAREYYDAEANAYTMVERGGGPRGIVVTGSSWPEHAEGVLEIEYNLYGPDGAGNLTDFVTGRVQVEPHEDGVFYYLNNSIDRS